ncbi:hypothetical protein KAT92_00815 [Candidatus Babeliales bacterium]|nr:hypothetical protein [Candidatus Babeliales bacterium]
MNKNLPNIFELDVKQLVAFILLLLVPFGAAFPMDGSGGGDGTSYLQTAPENSSDGEMSEGDVSEVEVQELDETQEGLTRRRRVGNGMAPENFRVSVDVSSDINSYIQELLRRSPESVDAVRQVIREIQGVSLQGGGRRNRNQTIRVNVTSGIGATDLYAALERISGDNLGDADALRREGHLEQTTKSANLKIRRANSRANSLKAKYERKKEALIALRRELDELKAANRRSSRIQTRTETRDAGFENERTGEMTDLREENASLHEENGDLNRDMYGAQQEARSQRNCGNELSEHLKQACKCIDDDGEIVDNLDSYIKEVIKTHEDQFDELLVERNNAIDDYNGLLDMNSDRSKEVDALLELLTSSQVDFDNALQQLDQAQGQLNQAEANARWYRNAFYAALALDIIQLTAGASYATGKVALRLPSIIRAGLNLGRSGYHTAVQVPGLMRELREILPQIRELLNSELLNSEHLDAQKVYEMLQALLDKLKCECPSSSSWFG